MFFSVLSVAYGLSYRDARMAEYLEGTRTCGSFQDDCAGCMEHELLWTSDKDGHQEIYPGCSFAQSTGECLKITDLNADHWKLNLLLMGGSAVCPARSVFGRSIRESRMSDGTCSQFANDCGACTTHQLKFHLEGEKDGQMMLGCHYAQTTGECIKTSDMTAADMDKNLVGGWFGGVCPARSVNARGFFERAVNYHMGECSTVTDGCEACMAHTALQNGRQMEACAYDLAKNQCVNAEDAKGAFDTIAWPGEVMAKYGMGCRSLERSIGREPRESDGTCSQFTNDCDACTTHQLFFHGEGEKDGQMMLGCHYAQTTGECIKTSKMGAADMGKNLLGAWFPGTCPARGVTDRLQRAIEALERLI